MKKEKFLATIILLLCLISVGLAVYLILLQKIEISDQANFPTALLLEKKKIAVVNIYGAIQSQGERAWTKYVDGAEQIVEQLKGLSKDNSIGAVVLRINSPGGSVAAVQEIYEQILRLKHSGKKVVASFGDISASGAYYIACGADKIVSNPGSLVGSIGVIISTPNLKGLLEKLGVEYKVIKSSQHKDIGSVFRKMTEEEQRLLQGVVDNAYHQFFNVVSANRKAIKKEDLVTIADGRIFTGEQAKRVGLVDELGSCQQAIKIAAELAEIEGEPTVIKIEDPFKKLFNLIENKYNPFKELEHSTEAALLEYRYQP